MFETLVTGVGGVGLESYLSFREAEQDIDKMGSPMVGKSLASNQSSSSSGTPGVGCPSRVSVSISSGPPSVIDDVSLAVLAVQMPRWVGSTVDPLVMVGVTW